MRGGIKAIINSDDSLEVIGEASDGEEAIALIESKKPDILILDISMPKKTGLEVLRVCDLGSTKVIILSNYDEKEFIIEAVKLGAKAYVLKDIEASNIVNIIHTVHSGKTYYSQLIMRVLVDQLNYTPEQSALTKKEIEIVVLIAEGKSSKMIAEQLFISTRTVDSHRYNIMKKMEVSNSAELINKAYSMQLIQLPS